MPYVDANLCTGCGTCADVCAQGAISLGETVATIDEACCTSCGRCFDVCPARAIIDVQVVSELPLVPAPTRYPQAAPERSEATFPFLARPPVTAPAAMPAVSPTPEVSKLEIAQRVFTGLFGVIGFVLDRRQRRSTGSSLLKTLARNGAATAGSSGIAHPCKAQARRRGRGRGGRAGLGGGWGRNGQACANRRDRGMSPERSSK
jgi:NAD-dependent dihydropyrimidine dehydrogenase PreA subunit